MKLIEKDTPGQRIADLCKDYGISQKELAEKIGLSENAIKGLVTETIDVEILNRLLENPKFLQLLNLIRIYFEDSVV